VILIDARNGVVTQSRRHAYIASLLGIPHLVVAVNKMDLVNYSSVVFSDIREEFGRFAAGLSFRNIVYIPVSALKGDMVVDRGENLPW
jgi:sulfate adenylyltransferase subunit 1